MIRRIIYFITNDKITLLDIYIYISGNAARMIEGRQSSDAIFMNCFFSSEGYYSQLVFKENIIVKIVGRGFDDFSTSPVVVYQGRMMRCNADIDLSTCSITTKSVDHHNNSSNHNFIHQSSIPVNHEYLHS